jgi:hypothetical protein
MRRHRGRGHGSLGAMATLFALDRHEDITQVSGTGRVAYGVELDHGLLMTWTGEWQTVGWYPDRETVEHIHGHQGASELNDLGNNVHERERAMAYLSPLVTPALTGLCSARRAITGGNPSFGLDRRVRQEGSQDDVQRLAIVTQLELGDCLVAWWVAPQWTLAWYPSLSTVRQIHQYDGVTGLVPQDWQDSETAQAEILDVLPKMIDTVSQLRRHWHLPQSAVAAAD